MLQRSQHVKLVQGDTPKLKVLGVGNIGYRRPNTRMLSDPGDIECPPYIQCFKVLVSHRVRNNGFFELHGNVTLTSQVHPGFQLKAEYGCVGGDDSESVDIPRDYVTIVSESTEQPIEPPAWTHVFNYDS